MLCGFAENWMEMSLLDEMGVQLMILHTTSFCTVNATSYLTKTLSLAFSHCSSEVFQTLPYYNLAWSLPVHTRLDDLDIVSGDRCVRIINCRLFFRFLATVV